MRKRGKTNRYIGADGDRLLKQGNKVLGTQTAEGQSDCAVTLSSHRYQPEAKALGKGGKMPKTGSSAPLQHCTQQRASSSWLLLLKCHVLTLGHLKSLQCRETT